MSKLKDKSKESIKKKASHFSRETTLMLQYKHIAILTKPFIRFFSTIHSTSFVDPTATVSKNTTIGPFSYIGPNCSVGNNCHLGSHCTILHSNIGNRVILHSGVRVGQDGFGFFPSPPPPASEKSTSTAAIPEKKPQTLSVIIQDDVEIGANTTIDRGSWRDTSIGIGTKIDNLVQIGHNVVIGTSCLIAAQTGIAGSTTIGDRVLIGGQVGIAQHLNIGTECRIAAKSGVIADVQQGQTVGGYPAVDIGKFRRQAVKARRDNEKRINKNK